MENQLCLGQAAVVVLIFTQSHQVGEHGVDQVVVETGELNHFVVVVLVLRVSLLFNCFVQFPERYFAFVRPLNFLAFCQTLFYRNIRALFCLQFVLLYFRQRIQRFEAILLVLEFRLLLLLDCLFTKGAQFSST
jgi:hypothetical protein